MRNSLLIALLIATVLHGSAFALPFDRVSSGGRAAAMSGMQAILSRGAESVLGNPSYLGGLDGMSFQAMTRDWYGSGMHSYSAAYAQPFAGGGVGLAWHNFGLSDLWTENLVALSGAWLYQLPTGTLQLGIGGSIKGMQVAAPGYEGSDYQGDFTTWAGDLAVYAEPFPYVRMTWVGENIAAGDMTLLNGGSKHRSAPSKQRTGFSVRWREDLLLAFEYYKHQDFDGKFHFGGELGFFRAFYVRAGAGSGFATAGFGLDGGNWQADGAFESRGVLGTSLIFSFRFQPGKEGESF